MALPVRPTRADSLYLTYNSAAHLQVALTRRYRDFSIALRGPRECLGRIGQPQRRECPVNGVTRLRGSYLRPADRRPSKVMSNAFSAAFHRTIQRFRPVPVGSRLITAR